MNADTIAAQPTTREVDRLLAHYGISHQNPVNERIHFICIPAILFSLVGLLAAISPLLAIAFLATSLVYYARLSWVFFAAMALVSAGAGVFVAALGSAVLPVSVAIFFVAWVGQFIGHKIEGKKPSFFEDVRYLWVGPLFCLSALFKKIGVAW